MQDQQWQPDQVELLLEPLIGSDHLGHGLRRLHLVRDERVLVQGLHPGGIPREVLVVELQHVSVRRHVREALERGEGEVRRRHAEREALADQPGELALMEQCVDARDDAAGAVTEEEHGQPRLPRLRQRHQLGEVTVVVLQVLDVVALTIGLTAATQIDGIDREPRRSELLGDP